MFHRDELHYRGAKMPEFTNYLNFLTTLAEPNRELSQAIVATTGLGRNMGYKPPTESAQLNAKELFNFLRQFDMSPNRGTFAALKLQATIMDMSIQRLKNIPEWIYIAPKNDKSSREHQFTVAYHLGTDSEVFAFNEHSGKDGTHIVVEEMAERVPNLKAIITNARHPTASKDASTYQNEHNQANWAHSGETIAVPICRFLKEVYPNSVFINVHGMNTNGDLAKMRNAPDGVRPSYALIVNNWNSRFTRETASYPTLLAIALAKYFPDRELQVASDMPGLMFGKPLTRDNNINCLLLSPAAPHNTNYIGRKLVNVTKDTGRSCHIEFDSRLRRGGSKLINFTQALIEANHWWKHYKHELHNPWKLKDTHPEINNDMRRYGELFPPMEPGLQNLLGLYNINSHDLARWDNNLHNGILAGQFLDNDDDPAVFESELVTNSNVATTSSNSNSNTNSSSNNSSANASASSASVSDTRNKRSANDEPEERKHHRTKRHRP